MTIPDDEQVEQYHLNVPSSVLRHPTPGMVYWCPHCEVPLISPTCDICAGIGQYCGADLKPIFPQERELLEGFLRNREVIAGQYTLPRELYVNRGRVIWRGQRLFEYRIKAGEFVLKTGLRFTLCDHSQEEGDFFSRAVEANKSALLELEREALSFIAEAMDAHPQAKPVVAFSGGKDSAATAYMVSRIACPVLFFSNTTIEYPETYDYITSFAESFGLELVREEPDTDFLTMCERLGPPSRVLRWCCSVYKGTLLTRFLNRLGCQAVNFDGIRRQESNRRSKYDRVARNPKVVKQITFRPILHWTSLEVWLYNFWRNLPLNPLYRMGFGRVGCYACPNNTEYDDFLTEEFYPELWKPWQSTLAAFFDKEYEANFDESDREQWLMHGLWKKRTPHRDTKYTTVSRPCLDTAGLLYEMAKPLDDQIVEFLKPLGEVRFLHLSERDTLSLVHADWYYGSGTLGNNDLAVSFLNSHTYRAKLLIQRQIRKWLNCVGCGACAGTCPTGAIRIQDGSFRISDDLCTKCQECVKSNFTGQGCVALSYKNSSIRIRQE